MAKHAARSFGKIADRVLRAVAESPEARNEIDAWLQERARGGRPRSAVLTLAVNGLIDNAARVSLSDASGKLIASTRVPVIGLNPTLLAIGALAAVTVGLVLHRIARLRGDIAKLQESFNESNDAAFSQAVSYCTSAIDRGDRLAMRLGELPLRQSLAVQLAATARLLDAVPKFKDMILFDNDSDIARYVLAADAQLDACILGLDALNRLIAAIRGGEQALAALKTLPLSRLRVAIDGMLTRIERTSKAESHLQRWRSVEEDLKAMIEGQGKVAKLPSSPIVIEYEAEQLEDALRRFRPA